MRATVMGRWLPVAAVAGLAVVAIVAAVASGSWDRLVAWVFVQQKLFQRVLMSDLQAVARDGGLWTTAALVGASFAYGVLHAAGPGHGKAVITTYLLSQGERVRRGVLMATGGALMQGAVAIALVYGVLAVIGVAARQSGAAVDWSTRTSFVLVVLLGVGLAWRAGQGVWCGVIRPGGVATGDPVHAHDRDHRHRHDHKHGHDHRHNHGHNHGHGHGGGGGCGHAHGPDAADLESARSLPAMLAVIVAMGLRPCSGAILVLVLARSLGLVWTGVAAVAAMSVGTALTVASLAVASVLARGRVGWLARAWGVGDSPQAALAGRVVALAGGLILMALGGALLAQSFRPAHPLGL